MLDKTLLISEIFGPVVQGEGPLIGTPTVFVRTGGCDYQHCSWCDTLYAVLPKYKDEWLKLTSKEVLNGIYNLSNNKPILVTLSGGNPALQEFREIIISARVRNYQFAVETQGSRNPSWFDFLDYLILSPKPPSSKMETDWEMLKACSHTQAVKTYLKVVVFDEVDYQYAKEVRSQIPSIPFYLQTGSDYLDDFDVDEKFTQDGFKNDQKTSILARIDWLQRKVLEDRWNDVCVLPQLHTLIHGNKRGV